VRSAAEEMIDRSIDRTVGRSVGRYFVSQPSPFVVRVDASRSPGKRAACVDCHWLMANIFSFRREEEGLLALTTDVRPSSPHGRSVGFATGTGARRTERRATHTPTLVRMPGVVEIRLHRRALALACRTGSLGIANHFSFFSCSRKR
jgi:hypothetical protein